MKKSKFTEQQIAFALHQAESGISVAEVCRKMGVSEASFYLYGRLSRCKTGMSGCPDPWQTSFRRQPAVAGAPKWGIRTRAPLQLVGLAGLDKSQARRAPARSVQSISPSSRNRLEASGNGAVRFAGAQHGPDNPCCFVGDGNRCPVEAAPLPKIVDPLVVPVVLVWRGSHNRPGAVDQQAAQVLATPLRYRTSSANHRSSAAGEPAQAMRPGDARF
jgi:putative transposase